MKKIIFILGFLAFASVVNAQTFPLTLRAQWDVPPPTEAVTNFLFSQDGGAQVSVPNSINVACNCIQFSIVIATAGTHSISVVAQNLAVSTDPNSKQSSAPTTLPFDTIQFAGRAVPSAPRNPRVIR